MKSVGIIGFGSFGQFMAEQLDTHCSVSVYSASGKQNKWTASLEEVAQTDFVILAIPLDAYDTMLKQLKPLLREDTVIVDVCSVKEQPMKIINQVLPNQPAVATHPLFGPESAANTIKDHVLVLCPDASDATALAIVERFASKLGLQLRRMSTEEHDREMAVVQGLTFFIARVLDEFRLHKQTLSTASFEKLLSLARLEEHHSDDLFYTIQVGNHYTQATRKKFLEFAQRLDEDITENPKQQ